MATELAKAYVQIIPSAEGISGSLSKVLDGEATTAGKSAGGKFSSAMGGILKTGAAAIAGIGTAAVGVGTALTNQAASVAAYGDNIDKMSQKMGMSAEAYQEWDAVMQHSGTSMETMKASMKTLANAAQTGNDAFKELGITENDLKTLNQEQLFEATIAGLQQVDDTTQRTYLAGQLLGRGATELGALLNTSAEDTQAMRDRVHELGGVMSDEAVKNSAAFKDSLQDMGAAFTGVKNSIISEMLPSFTSVIDGFTSLVTGEEGAKEKITTGIQGIVAKIQESLPNIVSGFSTLASAIMEVAPELISTLSQGILDATPQLMPSLIQLAGEIGSKLIELLPQLSEVGLQVILELANGLGAALPTLIPTIVDTMLMIVDTLISNADLLVDAAVAIIVGLSDGLVAAMPQLTERLPEIVIKICDALIRNAPKLLQASVAMIVALADGLFKELPSLLLDKLPEMFMQIVNASIEAAKQMVDAGKAIVDGLWEGIQKNWGVLASKVKEKGRELVESVKGFFKIGSPSKLFADEIGKWIPEGVAVGIEANADSVNGAVEDMVNEAMIGPDYKAMTQTANAITPSLTSGVVAGADSNMVSLLNQYLPLLLDAIESNQVTLEGDAKDMFRLMRKENNQFMKANGVSAFA